MGENDGEDHGGDDGGGGGGGGGGFHDYHDDDDSDGGDVYELFMSLSLNDWLQSWNQYAIKDIETNIMEIPQYDNWMVVLHGNGSSRKTKGQSLKWHRKFNNASYFYINLTSRLRTIELHG